MAISIKINKLITYLSFSKYDSQLTVIRGGTNEVISVPSWLKSPSPIPGRKRFFFYLFNIFYFYK